MSYPIEREPSRIRKFFSSLSVKTRFLLIGSAVMLFLIAALAPMTHTYVVKVDDKNTTIQATRETTDELLDMAGVDVGESDVVYRTASTGNYDLIRVYKAYPVTIEADGVSKSVMLTFGNVSDALNKAEIKLDENDSVSVGLTEETKPNMEIVVSRVDYDERVEIQEIPYDTVQKGSYLLGRGEIRVTSIGVPGKKEVVYRDKVVDGVVIDSEVVSIRTVSQPRDEIVSYGLSPRRPYSLIEPPASFALNSNGVPTHYKRVIRNAVSTAYSAKAGSYTASGRRAFQGTVAVNPNVIPYGSRLYIASSDNRYVYGYAIATDTGTGLMNGRIDVDLFFNTYEASCRWGVKSVNIYILD